MSRWRYDKDSKSMVEIGSDWTDTERRAPVATEELVYGNVGPATDGAPLNSRRKHRDYLQQNNLALASDYTETWKQAAKRREDFFAGRHKHEGLREAIGRAVDKVRGRKP